MPNNNTYEPNDNCGAIISSKTLPLSTGVNITPIGINGPIVAKIPVVLAEREIQIDIEAEFRLQEPYYEIKRIKKNVYLTQCKLLTPSGIINDGCLISGKLFISGYVRKNIEYATAVCTEDKVVSGRIAHTTVDTPFTAVTEVEYSRPPIVNSRKVQNEIDFFSSCSCNDCEGNFIEKSECEQSFEDNITFTENPYCELEGVRIIELDLHRDPIDHISDTNIFTYNKLIEKIVVYVRVKVLQLQQVNIAVDDDDQ